MLSFILNSPYTLLGLIISIFCGVRGISFRTNAHSFIIKVKSFWWVFGYMKHVRAMTIGHVILLGPQEAKNDLEHELIHVQQYEKYPLIFPFLYYFELFRKGYRLNKYEEEAYSKAGNVYRKRD